MTVALDNVSEQKIHEQIFVRVMAVLVCVLVFVGRGGSVEEAM